MAEIRVKIIRESRRFNENAAVFNVKYESQYLDVIAQAEDGDLVQDQYYTMTGTWKTHPRFGRQFIADTFVESISETREAVTHYLTKYPSIGEATANKIVLHYGDNTLEKLVADHTWLATLPRISPDQAAAIKAMVAADLQMCRSKIEIMAYLAGSGLPKTLTESLYRKYGVLVKKMLIRNPYLLLQYHGCGFTSVDKFALAHGYPPLRIKRQALFLLDYMSRQSDIWTNHTDLLCVMLKQFGTGARVTDALRLLTRSKKIVSCEDTSRKMYATAKDVDDERRIAFGVCQHLVDNYPVPLDVSDLSESQASALLIATSKRIGCFVGGPGTGKTYSVARYIRAVVKQYGADNILVCAPTGKAVVRSREMLASIGVADVEASTIHSYLYKGGGYRQFVVVDESSMIDAALMREFLASVSGSSLLFVGDDGQLLPVGKGRPFADFLTSGIVPVGKLSQTMRNSGRIVQVCHEIRAAKPWKPSSVLDVDNGENLLLIPSTDFLRTTKEIIATWRNELDTIKDVQVIVGVNRGMSGREALNRELQAHINPSTSNGSKYREKDPVICLCNSTYKDREGHDNVYLSNGEIGYVIETAPYLLVDFGSDKVVRITETHQAFDLAYAVTCHKMQGSETPIAIVCLDPSYAASMVCSREWLYTAISRAKKACYLVGDYQTATKFCAKLGNIRKTKLVEEIHDCKQKYQAATSVGFSTYEMYRHAVDKSVRLAR